MRGFSRYDKGRCSESFVRLLYERRGYTLLAQNFHCVGSELDLVLAKESLIVIVEVKLRKSFPTLDGLISENKKKALRRGTDIFLQKQSQLSFETVRFDLCLVKYQNVGNAIKILPEKIYYDFL